LGRYPFLQPGQRLCDTEEEEVLEWIDESESERGVQLMVSSDTRMSGQMKSFLLRCLMRNPNFRPAAIDLASDPWVNGVSQEVSRAL
jgi:hypothetical protein